MSAIPKDPLVSLIEKSGVEASNTQSPDSISNLLFQPNAELSIKSLDDEQLLIKVPFSSPVKISSLKLKCSTEAIESGRAPKLIKLFTNDLHIDFSLAMETQPKQTIVIESDKDKVALGSPGGLEVILRYVNFQNVRNVTVFIESNQGEVDVSELGSVEFYGSAEASLDMNKWKKGENNDDE